ncbi:lysosome-associated membrane glycoprotein 5 [Onthophagus taurus]|uniref:lysosome-associated membrane glycoprotein 5 n=1 Tax=Onthophagus taurus TaxID=166361 RepID=UPI000C20ADF0|nr:uncharacterized protein LOC111417227 [Onthophagus taurus]
MAKKVGLVYFTYLVLSIVFLNVSSLTLPYMVTSKPRHTKYSLSTPAPGSGSLVTPDNLPATANSGISLYRVKSNGATCILLKTDGLIEITYKSAIDEEKGDTYMPDYPIIDGNCQEDDASMRLSWNGYSLYWEFAKTPGGERWYISKLELTVSKDLEPYRHLKTFEKTFKLVHKQMLFPTPVSNSFSCDESVIDLESPDEDFLQQDLRGKIFLRAFQLQPFMYKGTNFGPPFACNAQLGFRDETAPIAVGSTLAIAVLLTVGGYGVFRYFKVKKVQYNTME